MKLLPYALAPVAAYVFAGLGYVGFLALDWCLCGWARITRNQPSELERPRR